MLNYQVKCVEYYVLRKYLHVIKCFEIVVCFEILESAPAISNIVIFCSIY